MNRERLYIVHGTGNDAVGLVGSITKKIADAGGNIVDLRQDVLHGLFTVYMVVDLSGGEMRIDTFGELIRVISEDTGLRLYVEKYLPRARSPGRKNMLLILIGNDKPGIIASISQTLAKYGANIESSNTIAREGVFLMELMTDISASTLPAENLAEVLTRTMNEKGMQTVIQKDDVFNKKKRVLLFNMESSLMPPQTAREIMGLTGLTQADMNSFYPSTDSVDICKRAASLIEGLPVDIMELLAAGIFATPQTEELIQTLKTMGYRIALASRAFTFLTEPLCRHQGVRYCFGPGLLTDDDSRNVVGADFASVTSGDMTAAAIKAIASAEHVDASNITVLNDTGCEMSPGIRLEIHLETILGPFNRKVLTASNIAGILGCFGTRRNWL